MDPKKLVADGYDRLYRIYADWGEVDQDGIRHHYIDRAFELGLQLPAEALDLGCGTGRHATAYLVERGLVVTGMDISSLSIEAARSEVAGAQFIVGDMALASFQNESFDLITAFFSLIHLPRTEHAGLLARAASWLRPGGFLAVTMGVADNPAGTEARWLGAAPMYWSSWDAQTNLSLVEGVGLALIDADLRADGLRMGDEDGQEVGFLWVLARKP